MRFFWPFGTVLAAACATTSYAAPAPAPSGAIDISGHRARWEVGLDENALVAIQPSLDGIVALLASGHLARFDPATLRLTALRVGPEMVSALGSGGTGVLLAGTREGLVATVNPSDLSFTKVEKMAEEVTWVGGNAREVVAFGQGKLDKKSNGRAPSFSIWRYALGQGKTIGTDTQNPLPTVAFLDSRGVLWAGADRGEFGGWVEAWDTKTDDFFEDVSLKPDGFPGIYGFVESDGAIYTFGGTSHLLEYPFLARVAPGSPSVILRGDFERKSTPPGPITSMVADPSGGFLAVSSGKLWRVDRSLQEWTGLTGLSARSFVGRPDAVGNYSAVEQMVLARDGTLFLASRRDGLLAWREGAKMRGSALPGQIDDQGIRHLAASEAGLVAFGECAVWRRGPGGWENLRPNCGDNEVSFVRPDGALVFAYQIGSPMPPRGLACQRSRAAGAEPPLSANAPWSLREPRRRLRDPRRDALAEWLSVDLRADAAGLVARYPEPRGFLLWRSACRGDRRPSLAHLDQEGWPLPRRPERWREGAGRLG